jgi:tetratricopeptide (TPR) repeat protein
MRFLIFCTAFCLFFNSFVVNGQEYYKPLLIKPDSVEQGTRLFLERLQSITGKQSDEAQRLYRDSLASALIKADTVFANGKNTSPSALDTLLPRPTFRLINDLLWQNFRLSGDKNTAVSLLQILARHYPADEFVQGNLALAYDITGKTDSAKAVIQRYLALKPDGYTSMHIAARITDSGRAQGLHKIIDLGADSFRLFTENKLYQFPVSLDSLRNALAICILHRAGAIKAPDRITGRLILDFADLTVKDKLYSEALPFYDIATVYDAALLPVVAERKTVIAGAEKSVNDTFTWASIFYAIPLLSFVLILISWLRSKRNKAHQSVKDQPGAGYP